MTKGQRFKNKAIELIPSQDWDFVDITAESYSVLDEVILRKSEYMGGMAAVIINLLIKEGKDYG